MTPKKLVLIVVAIACVGVAGVVTLLIFVASWMFSKAGDATQTVQEAAQRVDAPTLDTSAIEPLNLASYINNGAVAADELTRTYEAIPSQLQGWWLDQFKKQLDALQEQSGISDDAIRSLTDIYNTLSQ